MSTNKIQFRPATKDDLTNIQTCARDAYSIYVKRIGTEPAPMVADFATQIELQQVHVAIYKSAFAGYIVFYREGDHLHLENVAIAPDQARKGIGKQLIAFAELTAKDWGLNAVELYTNEAMTENLALYPRLGYSETLRKRQSGFNRVFFRKSV